MRHWNKIWSENCNRYLFIFWGMIISKIWHFVKALIMCDIVKIFLLVFLPTFLSLYYFPGVEYVNWICSFILLAVHQPGKIHCCILELCQFRRFYWIGPLGLRLGPFSILSAMSVCLCVCLCHCKTHTSGCHEDFWSKDVFLVLACDHTILFIFRWIFFLVGGTKFPKFSPTRYLGR